jgi:hypothetical protein
MPDTDSAAALGTEHGRARSMPYAPADGSGPAEAYEPDGYVSYVFWDAGSALLMDAVGETGDTTDENWAVRTELAQAYCRAYAAAAGVPFDIRS